MKLQKLVAGVLSAAMVLSMSSTIAFADDVDFTAGETEMTFGSTLYLSNDALSAPNVTYSYTLANGTEATFTDNEDKELAISAGVDADKVTIDDAAFAATDAIADANVAKKVVVDFNSVTFPTTGIYHYTLTESDTEVTGLINENNQVRHIYVTVVTAGDGVAIDEIIMTKGELTDEALKDAENGYVKSAGFIHSFGIEGTTDPTDPEKPKEPGTDGDKDQDFIITTVAKGDMSNKAKAFQFATVTADLGATYAGMSFTVADAYSDAALTTPITKITADANGKLSASFFMSEKNSHEIAIKSVVEGMEFTATISDPATPTEGYAFWSREYDDAYVVDASTSLTDDLNAWAKVAEKTVAVDAIYATAEATDNEGIDFATVKGQREKDEDDDEDITYDAGFPDTGVVLDLAPYAIMMLLAAGFITLRATRKIEE